MKQLISHILLLSILFSCTPKGEINEKVSQSENFQYLSEQFADLKIIRYQIPGFDQLTIKQKKLVYFLTQAGLAGRDIIYDQNYRHNLAIRTALENIVKKYSGDKSTDDWKQFMVYTKRVWFSNGIHHHYGMQKIMPEFSQAFFEQLLKDTNTSLDEEIVNVIFDPTLDAKKVNLDPTKGLLLGSATNFYSPNIQPMK